MRCKTKGLTLESIKAIVQNDLRLFLDFVGDKALENVTHLDIQDFLIYCSEDRKNSDETIARKYTSVNMFLNTLIK
ncbi:MAG: site-specific integrase [Marinisporobacter sp.]|jgi:site-specific recombinase XerD|nr:site-specific integrase [Marinisporobacter sp.]